MANDLKAFFCNFDFFYNHDHNIFDLTTAAVTTTRPYSAIRSSLSGSKMEFKENESNVNTNDVFQYHFLSPTQTVYTLNMLNISSYRKVNPRNSQSCKSANYFFAVEVYTFSMVKSETTPTGLQKKIQNKQTIKQQLMKRLCVLGLFVVCDC